MAVRTDFTFNMEVSPRIITIAAPSVEATVQDIHSTITDYEDSIEGGQFPRLILSAGKEDLGGGVTVGITSTLQDAQIQFAGRTVATEFGAVSSNDTTGTLLNAVGGLFVTNGVSRGDTVFNSTTGSMATILSVTDETNLVSQQITGGARTTWLNTDNYSIYVNVQCNISGGNLVAVDDVGASLSSILQSPNTNVVRTASSSATLANQTQLEASSFFGAVAIDPASGYSGTDFPVGTREQPVNNIADAELIADARGFRDFFVVGNLTISSQDVSEGYRFIGDSPANIVVTVDASADVTNCEFQHCIIQGTLDGTNILRQCIVLDITVDTATGDFFQECALNGTITLVSSTSLNIWNCNSNFAGGGPSQLAVIDLGGATPTSVLMRKYNGGVKFINCSAAVDVSADVPSGRVVIDSTITAGTFTLRGGSCEVTHTQTGTETVTDKTIYKRTNDLWQFKGADPDNAAAITGDGVTSSVVTVDSKVLTITPTSITRT